MGDIADDGSVVNRSKASTLHSPILFGAQLCWALCKPVAWAAGGQALGGLAGCSCREALLQTTLQMHAVSGPAQVAGGVDDFVMQPQWGLDHGPHFTYV